MERVTDEELKALELAIECAEPNLDGYIEVSKNMVPLLIAEIRALKAELKDMLDHSQTPPAEEGQ